jgi:hypothetical protein
LPRSTILQPATSKRKKLKGIWSNATRKQLGLDRSTAGGTHSSAREEQAQEDILDDMSGLVADLKEGARGLQDHMQSDAVVLAKTEELTTDNLNKIMAQRKRLDKNLDDGIGLCTTISIIMSIVVSFVCTYLFMKLVPKDR